MPRSDCVTLIFGRRIQPLATYTPGQSPLCQFRLQNRTGEEQTSFVSWPSGLSTPDRRDPPEPLSPAARELLKTRMASHGRDMNDLVSAIMVLDYLRIEQRGDQIADDVSLARPLSHDANELNASLPEKFFVHQDKVKVEARALSDAARARNPYRVAEQYGRLSEGCVRCHADYRPRN
jgi:hypothetical protein